MKAFVIYLSENDFSVNMTAETIESLERFNIDYELFDGVVGRAGIKILESFGVRPSASVKQDQWTPGTIGCLASHYLLWDKCASQKETFLVLEQDGVLIRDPREIVPLVKKACHLDAHLPFESGNDAHFKVYNENLTWYVPGVREHPKNNFYIGNEITGDTFRGTYGYLITPDGARDIIKFIVKYGAFPSDKCMCSKATYIQRANSSYVRLNKFFSTLKIQKDYSLR